MKNNVSDNTTQQIGFGLTAAALLGSYCICACAATGQGLLAVLLCSVICIFTSLKLKKGIFSPDSFLLLPVFFIVSVSSPVSACISVLAGSFIFLILKKILNGVKIPDSVITGATLSLAIGVTILLTNHYFGIGAMGETPLEMLKSYRSLGFHPNFRGLLYGTITLFTMITYPFKFRKLNKYLPAEFITVLIPLILNLFLNPEKELTTINEINFLSLDECFKNIPLYFSDFSASEIPQIIKNGIAVGVILLGYSSRENAPETNITFTANALSGGFAGMPVRRFSVRGYGRIAAVTSLIVISLSVLLFPKMLSRIPMHCVGSMLIVSAWQNMPYKALAEVFRKRNILDIFCFALCIIPFLMWDIFTAVVCYLVIILIYNKTSPFSKERSGN